MAELVNMLVKAVEENTTVSFCSSHDATHAHPAFKALIALGNVALPELIDRMRRDDGNSWTDILAVDSILYNLRIPRPVFPEDHAGKHDSLRQDFVNWWDKGADGAKCKCGTISLLHKEQGKCPLCDDPMAAKYGRIWDETD